MCKYCDKALKCKTCGDVGAMSGHLPECTTCYEVEKRLDEYLKSTKGREFVINALLRTNMYLQITTHEPPNVL